MKFSISFIKIKNFRQYRGTHTLNFLKDPNKNVIIILGKNGAGKSNLLNAITWCLYGIEVHKDQETNDINGMPLINTTEISSLNNNGKICAEVTIHLDTDIGPWTIKREIKGEKDSFGKINYSDSKLTVIHQVGGQDKIDTDQSTQFLINNLLPEALKKFFFIDGEQLREFFKESTPEKILEAIDIVSQLDLVYRAREHLQHYERHIRKNVKDTTPQLKEVQSKIQIVQDQISILKSQIEKEKEEKNKNEIELNKIKDYLKNNSVQKISLLQTEREELEKDKKNLESHLGNREHDRNSYLIDIAPYIYLYKDLYSSYNLITEQIEKGELPPKIKETFIRELLEKGNCICGNPLDEHSKNILREYQKRLSLSELSEVSIIGKTTISEIFEDISKFPEKINEINKDIENIKSELEQKQRRLEQISKEIKNADIDEIKRNEERRDELISIISRENHNILIIENQIRLCNEELDKLKNREVIELSKNKKYSGLKKKLDLVKETLKILSDTEDIIKTKIRKQVEDNLNSNFKTLIRKKEAFKNISINENYDVRVNHVHGYNVINDLSAGEYMILGISFMSALMNISGFQAPVIIDTPLGKIDDEHREYITSELPKFLKGTQLILLVTPTEYDEKVKLNLQEYLIPKNFFEIIENSDKTESMVKQHGT